MGISLVAAIKNVLSDDDQDNVSLLSDDKALADVTEFISTGIPGVDKILGGGFAVGRASECFGPWGSGKTALAHLAIRENQRCGGTPVLLDFEAALDKSKMKQLQIDPTRLVYVTPKHIEQGWDIIWAIMEDLGKKTPDVPTLIVWDSIAAAPAKAELEDATTEKSHVGLVAKAMSRGCRKMFHAIPRVRAHMLWINQERANIGGFGPAFMQEKKTAGGEAIAYAVSQRLRCQKVLTIKDGTRASGYKIKVQTKKNRICAPHQKAEFVIDFGLGPSPALSVFADLTDARKLKPAGRDDSGKAVYALPWLEDPISKDDFIVRFAEWKSEIAGFYDVMESGSSEE